MDSEGDVPSVATSRTLTAVLAVVGVALLVLWVIWWVESYQQNRLKNGRSTWVDVLPFLAGDFRVHIDHTARLWADGRNPYRQPCDWVCDLFPYPPMVPRLFTWVSLTSTTTAIAIWLTALSAILTTGVWAAWRTRRSLGLGTVPLPLALAWVFYSTPVLMTLERGQCDGLVVAFLLMAVWLLRSRSRAAELAAGGLLAVAAWTKYYPGLTLLGLVAMRRWRPVAGFLLVGAAVAAYDGADVRQSIANGRRVMTVMRIDEAKGVHHGQHAISVSWKPLWERARPLDFLARVPGTVAAAGLLVPLAAWVTLRLWQLRGDDHLVYPYFLWLVALGTFAMPYSNDYNLVFLPMGVLAVWDRRDPVLVHMINGLLMLWWQPFRLPVGGDLLFAIKFAGLAALGASLVAKAGLVVPQRTGVGGESRVPALHVARGKTLSPAATPSAG
jgi:hypothetical protein